MYIVESDGSSDCPIWWEVGSEVKGSIVYCRTICSWACAHNSIKLTHAQISWMNFLFLERGGPKNDVMCKHTSRDPLFVSAWFLRSRVCAFGCFIVSMTCAAGNISLAQGFSLLVAI
jgi:hypothetical protein